MELMLIYIIIGIIIIIIITIIIITTTIILCYDRLVGLGVSMFDYWSWGCGFNSRHFYKF